MEDATVTAPTSQPTIPLPSPPAIKGTSRTITALMLFTTGIALAGNEVKEAAGTAKVTYTEIFIGGAVATTTLVLLSHAGDAGEQFATGLAVISFLSVLLIQGTPLLTGITVLTGNQKTPTPVVPTQAATAAKK